MNAIALALAFEMPAPLQLKYSDRRIRNILNHVPPTFELN